VAQGIGSEFKPQCHKNKNKITRGKKRAGDMVQVADYLLNEYKTLGINF
jgi:hypothetical protein